MLRNLCAHHASQHAKSRFGASKLSLRVSSHDMWCWKAVCRRAGGGFGGKVARSMPVAAAAAVAAHKTGSPVHYQLSRNDDMRMNGGKSF